MQQEFKDIKTTDAGKQMDQSNTMTELINNFKTTLYRTES